MSEHKALTDLQCSRHKITQHWRTYGLGVKPPLGIFFSKQALYLSTILSHVRLFLSFCFTSLYRAMHVLLRYCYRNSFVRPSVRLSVCDVEVPWA